MNNFTRGMVIGSIVGTAVGMISKTNSKWMKNSVLKPSKHAIKKATKVMNDVVDMM